MTNAASSAEQAAQIAAARDRQLAFVADCSDNDWTARALDG